MYKIKKILKNCGKKSKLKFFPSFKKYLFLYYKQDLSIDYRKKCKDANNFIAADGTEINIETIEIENLKEDWNFEA